MLPLSEHCEHVGSRPSHLIFLRLPNGATSHENVPVTRAAANNSPASFAGSPHPAALELDRLEAEVRWEGAVGRVDALFLGWDGHVVVVEEGGLRGEGVGMVEVVVVGKRLVH